MYFGKVRLIRDVKRQKVEVRRWKLEDGRLETEVNRRSQIT